LISDIDPAISSLSNIMFALTQLLVAVLLACQATAWDFAKVKIMKKNLAAAAVIASSLSFAAPQPSYAEGATGP
jgi:hypothetical protein